MSEEITLAGLNASFTKILNDFPDAKRALVEDIGEKMYSGVISNIERDVNECTGALKQGVKKVIGSKGGYAAVRADTNIAPHTHLVENGHEVVPRGKAKGKTLRTDKKKVVSVKRGFSQDAAQWVNGKFMYRNALTKLEKTIYRDAESMAERLVGDAFG
jgi:hypothetical protein